MFSFLLWGKLFSTVFKILPCHEVYLVSLPLLLECSTEIMLINSVGLPFQAGVNYEIKSNFRKFKEGLKGKKSFETSPDR